MAESRHLNNQHDWKVIRVTHLKRVISNWSGSVGMVHRMTMNVKVFAVLCCAALLLLVANPAAASAEPEIPSIPTTEQQVVEAPPVVVPEQPAPQPVPVPEPAPVPVPQPEPVPVPPVQAPPPPVVVLPPVEAPPATVPPVIVAPAPQTSNPPPPAVETRVPEVTATTTQAPAPRVEPSTAVVPAPEPAPRETEASTTSAAPSPTEKPAVATTQAPGQSSSSTPSPELEVPNQPDTTSTEQSSPESSSVPESSESATPSSESEPVKEESKEPVVVPDPEPVKVNDAVKASESEMQTLAAAESDPAPEADQKLVDEALMSTMGSPSTTSATPTTTTVPPTTSTSNPTTTSSTPTTTKKPWPGGHDKPWECKDNRGPRGCHWDGWKPDHGGHPVFTNPYKEYWQLVQWLDRWNNRYQTWVPPHSHLPVHVQDGGVYGFAILTLSARHHGVTLGVAFGAFSSPGIQCVRHPCHVPPRPTLNATFLVYIPFGPYRDRYIPRRVYDCGCEPVYHRDGRDYYRYYFEGYREVIVYKETRVVEGRPQQVIVPVEYRQTPVQQAPVPVTAGNVGDVVGIEPPGGDSSENPNTNTASDVTLIDYTTRNVAIAVVCVLIIGLALMGVVRVRRRRN